MAILIPYRGVVEIVADHDVGKTIAALQTVYPYKKTVFVDDDVKGDGTVRQMASNDVAFEKYVNLGEKRTALGDAPTPTELLKKVVMPTIDEITKSKHDVIIWDTWRIVYQSARGHVERNQNDFKDVVTFRGSSQIIQGLISKVARMIEQTQLNKLRNSCELLIVTHHMKDNYQNNVAVGRIPESSATFSEVSNMRLWLRRNTQSKVPIILFLKRPNLPKLVKGQMRFVNIVPMKIIPNGKHQSIWDAIGEYEANPIESREPKENERPTADEMAMISGTLSDEQKTYMLEMLKYQRVDEEAISEIVATKETIPSDYPVNGVSMISKALAMKMSKDEIEKVIGVSTDEIINDYKTEYWNKILEAKDGNNESSKASSKR